MKTLHIKTIDKTKWKTFKQEKPKVCEYIFAKDPTTKTTICGKYEGRDYIYEENGFLDGENIKFKPIKPNWIWIYVDDYKRMEHAFYDKLAKVSINDLVTTIVRKVVWQLLKCDADSCLNWHDGPERLFEDEEDD